MFLLLRGFLLTSSPSLLTLNLKSAFSLQRSFGGKSSWERIWSSMEPLVVLVCDLHGKLFVIHRRLTLIHRHRRWINTLKCALVIGGEVHVAWKRKMLDDVIGGYQAYIQRKKDLFIYLWSLEFRSWVRPRAVSRLHARFVRQDYKVATLGLELISCTCSCL